LDSVFVKFLRYDTGSIYAVNKEDGEIKWRQADFQYRKIGTGIIIDDYIAFGDYEGYVHLLSINDGSILGRIKLEDAQILNNIIKIDDSVLAFMTAAGDLICLRVGEIIINNEFDAENTKLIIDNPEEKEEEI